MIEINNFHIFEHNSLAVAHYFERFGYDIVSRAATQQLMKNADLNEIIIPPVSDPQK